MTTSTSTSTSTRTAVQRQREGRPEHLDYAGVARRAAGCLTDVFTDPELSSIYGTLVGANDSDVAWLVERIAPRGLSIVDLCGGSGRLAIALAEAGAAAVEVVDSSAAMLDSGARRAHAAGVGEIVRFTEDDALTHRGGGGGNDVVVIGGLSLTMFLDADARARVLATAAAALRPGGRLLLDISPTEPVRRDQEFAQTIPMMVDGRRRAVTIASRRDPEQARQRTLYYLHPVPDTPDHPGTPDTPAAPARAGAVDFAVLEPALLVGELACHGLVVDEVTTFYEHHPTQWLPPHAYLIAHRIICEEES